MVWVSRPIWSAISQFFDDAANAKLMAFRRATQFKGVIKKHLITIIDDSLHIVPDQLFKLDNDFDFLIFDDQILIWHPIGFIFTAEMDQQIAACAAANVDSIAEDITCVDFTGLKTFVSKHKLAMRLVAALKTRKDLVSVSKTRLRAECRDSGVKVIQKDGKLSPAEGSEMGFLMLLRPTPLHGDANRKAAGDLRGAKSPRGNSR